MDNDVLELPAETTFEVLLYIYDLSKELAKSFKKILKGKPLPAIWHTGLVAYGREYYFGSTGIESCRPGETILGEPDQILTLGKTELPYSVFLEYIFGLGETTYRPGSYNLLEHNCNCFSQEVSQFLTGGPIPNEIRDLPQEISSNKNLSSALKEYFNKLILRAEGSKGLSFGPAGRVPDEHRNGHTEHPEPKPEKKRKKSSASVMSANSSKSENAENQTQKSKQKDQNKAAAESQKKAEMNNGGNVENSEPAPQQNDANRTENTESNNQASGDSESAALSNGASRIRLDDDEDAPAATYAPRRSRRYEDPPIIFSEVDGAESLRRILELVESKLNAEEKKDLNEMLEYLTTDGGAWALGSSHLQAIYHLLSDHSFPQEIPLLALKVMQAAALKEDVILLLHQDREKHYLMSYFYRIESLSVEEQTEICGLMCNLCSNASSYDWLTYISEWEEEGRPCNNSRVTIRVAVHGLLAEHPALLDRGCALVFNLALKKELFDDIASELGMAVLQFLQSQLSEELLYQSLIALLRFMIISYNEIPALMKMMGPDVQMFKGMSARIDDIVEEMQIKLKVSR